MGCAYFVCCLEEKKADIYDIALCNDQNKYNKCITTDAWNTFIIVSQTRIKTLININLNDKNFFMNNR